MIFEFGLRGIMLLGENLKYNEDDVPTYLYAGLICKQPWITYQDCVKLEAQLSKKEKESLRQYINDNYISLTKEKIAELYSQSVGEVGILPSDFYSMTLDEIDLAYEGFLEKLEKEANLLCLAIKNALKNNSEYIRIKEEKGYTVGSEEEREQTFQLFWEEF